MDKVLELLKKRKWAKDCLRVNIAHPDHIISRGANGKFKVALVRSNLLGKKETELREAIRDIAPEWWDDETQVILNHNVQCKSHQDRNKEHSWILFLGDFTGGALCFEDDGSKFEERQTWLKFDGQRFHYNEPIDSGDKYSIVLYRSGAKKTKAQQVAESISKKKQKDTELKEAAGKVLAALTGLEAKLDSLPPPPP